MTKISIIQGDITTQNVDAIVNSANNFLRGGGGVDGAIHKASGPELLRECIQVGFCNTGEAKITKGYNLPTRHIIHTVGPVYGANKGKEAELLRSCYRSSLELAKNHGIKTIAFPAISVGVFRYPLDEATEIALNEVRGFIKESPEVLDEIRFVLFNREIFEAYSKLLDL